METEWNLKFCEIILLCPRIFYYDCSLCIWCTKHALIDIILHIIEFFQFLLRFRLDIGQHLLWTFNSPYEMSIRVTFRFGTSSYADKRAISLALMLILISLVVIYLEHLFQISRESNSSTYISNRTLSTVFLKCNIPYDNYRCSVFSNRSDNPIKCVTNIQAMAGHILPLVSYALQIYLIQELFPLTNIHNYDCNDLFWFTAVFMLAIIAIAVHGSSCLHFYTCMIICSTGLCLSGCVFYQLTRYNRKYSSRRIHVISWSQRWVVNYWDCQIMLTIVISQ